MALAFLTIACRLPVVISTTACTAIVSFVASGIYKPFQAGRTATAPRALTSKKTAVGGGASSAKNNAAARPPSRFAQTR
jgi:hypothetical protein